MAKLADLGFGNRSTRAQLRDSPGTMVSNKQSLRNEECLLVEIAHGWSRTSGVTVLSLICQVLLINHTVPGNETVQTAFEQMADDTRWTKARQTDNNLFLCGCKVSFRDSQRPAYSKVTVQRVPQLLPHRKGAGKAPR